MPPKKVQQSYIPGLTKREDYEFPDPEQEETEDDILKRDFLKGKKNPTMSLHEYCARNKMSLDFKEEDAIYRPGYNSRYGVRVYIDGLKYQQGVGGNKKEAKNEASRLAFRALVGLDNYVPEQMPHVDDHSNILEVKRLKDYCTVNERYYEAESIKKGDVFQCTVIVGGIDQVVKFHERREDAVILAHSDAIRLLGMEATPHASTLSETSAFPVLERPREPTCPNAELATKRQEYVHNTLNVRLEGAPPFNEMDHHVAAFFLSNNDGEIGELVAVGTGNCSLMAENLVANGRGMLDSSCVTVAKRSLRKYLAQEVCNYFLKDPSIFCEALDGSNKLSLCEGKSFHLYLSHPPNGDYQDFFDSPTNYDADSLEAIRLGGHIPTFVDETHGFLKCRSEGGDLEMTINTPEQPNIHAVKQRNELRLMSESDKLLRMNILGTQGGMLSLFINPVYISSLTMGFHPNNDHGHLCRAVCCRVYEDLQDELPPPYRINHPVLHFCPKPPSQGLAQLYSRETNTSINWNCYNALPRRRSSTEKRAPPTQGLHSKLANRKTALAD